MLAGVLRPAWVVHPDAVGGPEILLLQRLEEVSDNVFLTPEAKKPTEAQDDHNHGNNENKALAFP